MADQCIICLEDLDVSDGIVTDDLQDAGGTSTPEPPTTHPGKSTNQLPIALIKPCSHVLHDECLREWSQKANSCPICRHAFNLVEVLDKVNGESPYLIQIYYSLGRIICGLVPYLRRVWQMGLIIFMTRILVVGAESSVTFRVFWGLQYQKSNKY
jgi:hypothetical protein